MFIRISAGDAGLHSQREGVTRADDCKFLVLTDNPKTHFEIFGVGWFWQVAEMKGFLQVSETNAESSEAWKAPGRSQGREDSCRKEGELGKISCK